MNDLSIKMEKARKEYGLSRSDMSRLCGFGINQWRSYEVEGKTPNKSNMCLINMVVTPSGMLLLMNIIPDHLKELMGNRFINAYKKIVWINTLIESQVNGYKSSINEEYFD